jgi:polyhydroxybutyrate depolymerase
VVGDHDGGHLRRRRLFVALLVVAACGGSPATPPVAVGSPSPTPPFVEYLTFAGAQRTYVVYRPSEVGDTNKVPLVIALHGYTADTQWMIDATHYDDLAKSRGFEVVYPQGVDNSWNAGRCCGKNGGDDVGFLSALIEHLVAAGGIDAKRVFATGMSNGGFMVQRLACDLADRITAVASVSGSLVLDSCKPSRAISVLEMHGTADSLVPFDGGTVGGLTNFAPSMTVMSGWAKRDGCAAAPLATRSGLVTTYTWAHCRAAATVVLDAIEGEGHTWFNPSDTAGAPDATQTTWDFFTHAPPLT